MNWWTQYDGDPSDPRTAPDGFECACCGKWIEHDDPCKIDGEEFCDHCASDIMYLRFEEYIGGVAAKTKKLVEEYNREMNQRLWEKTYDDIKHKRLDMSQFYNKKS